MDRTCHFNAQYGFKYPLKLFFKAILEQALVFSLLTIKDFKNGHSVHFLGILKKIVATIIIKIICIKYRRNGKTPA